MQIFYFSFYFIQVDYIHAVEEVSTGIHRLFNCSLSYLLIRIGKIPDHHYKGNVIIINSTFYDGIIVIIL